MLPAFLSLGLAGEVHWCKISWCVERYGRTIQLLPTMFRALAHIYNDYFGEIKKGRLTTAFFHCFTSCVAYLMGQAV